MEEKHLKSIDDTIYSIYTNMPDSVDLSNVEDKLDKIIELLKKQCDISERIEVSLNNINENIPECSEVNTSTIESKLEKIWDKLDTLNSNVENISC